MQSFRGSQSQMRNMRVNAKAQQEQEQVAVEYGTGLAQLAHEEKCIDAVARDIQVFIDVFNADPKVREFLYDPLAPVEEKRGLVNEVIEKAQMKDYTANFLNLLIDMGRFEQLENCAEVFDAEILKIQGVQQVTVTSAIELDEAALNGIGETMKQMTGVSNLKLKQELDEDLLAGFVVETEGQRIDMSLKNELDQMRTELLKPADFKPATA